MDCSMTGLPVIHHLPELHQTHAHWVSDAIQPSHPLLPLCLLPSIFPGISVFSNESALFIRWPKYWSFSFSISPSNEYSGLISFRMDWLDLLIVQGTLLESSQTPQFKSIDSSVSAFSMVQLSHPYMTTEKTIPLTRWTFVGKVMSLLFYILSSFVIAFLPRNKCLLISWLKLQYFDHLMRRADLFEKTLMLGKIEGRRRRGRQRMRWLDGITDSMDMGLGGLWQLLIGRPGVLRFMGLQKLDTAERMYWTELLQSFQDIRWA